jgi:hypothetical protein
MFIYTINDIIGMFFLGILLILGAMLGMLLLVERVKDWWKNRK